MKAFSIIAIIVASLGTFGSLFLDSEEIAYCLLVNGFYLAVAICFYNSVKGTK